MSQRKEWKNMNYQLIVLRDNDTMNGAVSHWFHEKWGVDESAYLESIEDCQRVKNGVPQWYILMDGDKIIAGMGVIENDFHDRKDLAPNICAVFTEEEYRGRGLARYLLNYVCADLACMGIDTAYLVTDHKDFYEKCGFHYLCMVNEEGGDTARMYRRISKCGESAAALKTFLDGAGRITALPAKRKMKLHALVVLSEKFIGGRVYTEKEVNAVINEWHTYGDPVTWRRELCDHKILLRDDYGKEYRLSDTLPTIEQLEKIYG